MKKAICVMLLLMIFCGCSEEPASELISHDFIAMDTVFTLNIDNSTATDAIFKECEDLTAELESVLSSSNTDSDIFSFNSDVNALFDADPVFVEVLSTALEISELTSGTYDPAIGALTSLWNVKGGGPVPASEKIKYAMSKSGSSLIKLEDTSIIKSDPEVKLDLGGIGKGYAAQKLAWHLFDSDVSYGIVSAGRTVGVFGEKPDGNPFKIGIADPFNEEGVVGYLYTESGFVSVAGDYEIYFEENGTRYHHIIDPATGYPSASGLTSVAVLSQNGASADALCTALMVMGYDKGMEFYRSGAMPFEAIFIGSDGSVELTDGLTSDRFELSDSYKVTTGNAHQTTADTTASSDVITSAESASDNVTEE